MPLISVVLTLMVVGILLWVIETYIPLASPIKVMIRAVVVIVCVLWLLEVVGLLPLANLQVPRIR